MSSELGLDPSDPLNLLLHNSATDSDSDSSVPPQDWSKFSTMWSDQPDIMDFSMNMDMDYSAMGIEPSALHFNPAAVGYPYDGHDPSFGDFTFQYPQPPSLNFSASPQSFTKERRLSVTSSSSSSGASFSPVPESPASPTKEEPIANDSIPSNDPAAELAARVRATAGVMLAVPMNGYPQGAPHPTHAKRQSQSSSSSSPKSSSSSSLSSAESTPPPATPPSSSAPLTVNTLGHQQGSTSPDEPTPTTAAPTATLPRPKTSHTTIERRYRTNLNARIQSLRMAVPALRVLEDRDGGNGKKIKKNVKGSVLVKGTNMGVIDSMTEDGTVVDIIDERGFVDGVKVARKCSKANVLGKAVEYIRVLKKREMRLKAEQAGLKTLISGLVGGPALVREWEKEWHAKFGGEERDEIEADDMEEGDDDEDDEDDDGEGDEDSGRKRKRAKTTTAAAKKEKRPSLPAPAQPSAAMMVAPPTDGAPEKRKRGRPRKILPPPTTVPSSIPQSVMPPIAPLPQQDTMMHPPQQMQGMSPAQWAAAAAAAQVQAQAMAHQQHQQQQSQAPQYLLAVFALFSFFNSPLTSTFSGTGEYAGHQHAQHTGKVLSAVPLAYAPDIVAQFTPPSVPSYGPGFTAGSEKWKEYVQLFHLLVSLLVLASFVGNWFGYRFDVSVVKMVEGVKRGRSLSSLRNRGRKTTRDAPVPVPATPATPNTPGIVSGKGWVGVGEEVLMDGTASTLSYLDLLQIYRSITPSSSISDSITASLVLATRAVSAPSPLSSILLVKARSLWEAAKMRATSPADETRPEVLRAARTYEKMVLLGMTVEEASAQLVSAPSAPSLGKEGADEDSQTPVKVLARMVVKERVKKVLGRMFVDAVGTHSREDDDGADVSSDASVYGGQDTEADDDDVSEERRERQEKERSDTVDACRELGGSVLGLGRVLERFGGVAARATTTRRTGEAATTFSEEEIRSWELRDGDIKSLVVALVLFWRLFGSSTSSSSESESSSESSAFTSSGESDSGLVETETDSESTSTLTSSTLLSPPPSPLPRHRQPFQGQLGMGIQRKGGRRQSTITPDKFVGARLDTRRQEEERRKLVGELRKVLGGRVFEEVDVRFLIASPPPATQVPSETEESEEGEGEAKLEEARDRVVDLIVESERCARAVIRS